MSASIATWIAERDAPTVMPLERWLGPEAGSAEDGPAEAPVSTLTGLASAALGSALALPGQQREGAFHLLAADALLTYACEAALETEDPEGALRRILDDVSEP